VERLEHVAEVSGGAPPATVFQSSYHHRSSAIVPAVRVELEYWTAILDRPPVRARIDRLFGDGDRANVVEVYETTLAVRAEHVVGNLVQGFRATSQV
jgi:hypothetical protein